GVGDCAASARLPRLCAVAQAVGSRTHLCLAWPLEAIEPRLRASDPIERGDDLLCLSRAHATPPIASAKPTCVQVSTYRITKLPDRLSVHSDTWSGTAAELAECGVIAVFPVTGWWKERPHLNCWNRQARYSL